MEFPTINCLVQFSCGVSQVFMDSVLTLDLDPSLVSDIILV